jgi:hypothetical protein
MLFEFLSVNNQNRIAMKRLLTISAILSLALAGCYREPFAEAVISPNPAYVGEEVSFTNISYAANGVEWSFGDGTTSSVYNVIHYYDDPGFYNVDLKAFGTKGDVNIASYVLEVIGSEVKIIVKLWTPEGEPEGYLLEGASVILYPTLDDWIDQTNSVGERFTNQYGECIFSGLSNRRYYVDVWEQSHHNYWLAEEDVGWIETQQLEGLYDHTFIAYVDYDPDMKKSAMTARPDSREMLKKEGNTNASRNLKINKVSKPKKK